MDPRPLLTHIFSGAALRFPRTFRRLVPRISFSYHDIRHTRTSFVKTNDDFDEHLPDGNLVRSEVLVLRAVEGVEQRRTPSKHMAKDQLGTLSRIFAVRAENSLFLSPSRRSQITGISGSHRTKQRK